MLHNVVIHDCKYQKGLVQQIYRHLVDMGANPNAHNRGGLTPLGVMAKVRRTRSELASGNHAARTR